MKFVEKIDAKANVRIIARERGKKVPGLCRDEHNVWVNIGREYLAKVISPTAGFTGHVNDSVVEYMGLGIGGDQQLIDLTGPSWTTLAAHYPGQNIFDDTDISIPYMERPVKVTGTAGTGTAPGDWLSQVAAPPTFLGTPITSVDFETLFDYSDINLAGAYPAVPLSEAALVLSSEVSSRLSNEVYDYGSPPDYINVSTRQKLVAYNTFATLTKTVAVSLEVHWEIQF
jgi:hypothetical protein